MANRPRIMLAPLRAIRAERDELEMPMSGMLVARVRGAAFDGVAVADGLAYCRAGCGAERA